MKRKAKDASKVSLLLSYYFDRCVHFDFIWLKCFWVTSQSVRVWCCRVYWRWRDSHLLHEFQLKDKSLMLMLCIFTSHNHLFEVWSVEGNAKYYCIEDDSDNAEIQYCLDLTRLTPPTCIWNLCWLYFAFILKYFSGLCMWEFTDITRTWKFIECLPAESHVFSFCVKYALSICCVSFECQHVQNSNADEAKNDQRLSKTTKTNSSTKKD